MQEMRFPRPVLMSGFTLKILEVHPGTTYHDTCIAEVRVSTVPPGK